MPRPAKTESKHTAALCKVLRDQGALVVPNVAGDFAMFGVADRFVVHTKWQGYLEMKGERTKITDYQKKFLRDVDVRWPGHAFQVRFHAEGSLIVTQYMGDRSKMDRDFAAIWPDKLLDLLAEVARD